MNFFDTGELTRLFPDFSGAWPVFQTVGTVLSVAVAVCTLFWGYKLLKFWVSLAGFVIGAILGGVAGLLLQSEAKVLIGAILAAGFVFACLAFFLYKVGIFLFVGIAGYGLATTLLLGWMNVKGVWWIPVIGIAAGLVAGILAVKYIRVMVIVFTALNGGATLAFTICPLIGVGSYVISLAVAAVFAIMGLAWQFHSTTS